MPRITPLGWTRPQFAAFAPSEFAVDVDLREGSAGEWMSSPHPLASDHSELLLRLEDLRDPVIRAGQVQLRFAIGGAGGRAPNLALKRNQLTAQL